MEDWSWKKTFIKY